MSISSYIQIITLSINRFSSPIKRHRVAEWFWKKEKTRSNNMLSTVDPLEPSGHT